MAKTELAKVTPSAAPAVPIATAPASKKQPVLEDLRSVKPTPSTEFLNWCRGQLKSLSGRLDGI
jgi:hypothetical protein